MKIFVTCLCLAFYLNVGAQTVITVGDGGTEYLNLQDAFTDINAGNVTGDIVLEIIDDCTQEVTAILYPSGYMGNSDYTSILIYPTVSGKKITGSINGPLIELRGAANVTIDGRLNNQPGPTVLEITNSNTGSSASTIKFSESANNIRIHDCKINGSETGAASGVIFFSTASSGSGNDNIKIDHNLISADPKGRPVNAIFSYGTSGSENSGNIISNNYFFDFFNLANDASGIHISDYSSAFTITRNSFYETAPLVPVSASNYYGIRISSSGGNFSITNNYIGGIDSLCLSSPFTKTGVTDNEFYGIYISAATGASSSVQNNFVRNFDWSNLTNVSWTGIHIAGGDINVGTITGNVIGEESDPGSITITNAANPQQSTTGFYGINITGSGTVDCRNNTICSVTTNNNVLYASNIYGINKVASTGTTIISNNLVGSITNPNSINASSLCSGTGTQVVMGINNSGSSVITINNNTIANLTNATNNTSGTRRGLINGISSTDGTVTISGNTIRDLSIANVNNTATYQASICGIALTGVTSLKTVTGNTIYNLKNTNTSASVYSIIGIFHTGTTSASNSIRENFIHSLTAGTGSTNASVYGIKINSGTSTYANNIISLGGNTVSTLYGIYETGTTGNNNNLFFNTIYIGGNVSSGAKNSFAFWTAGGLNTRDIRNNVFHNARSNTGATGFHYALYNNAAGGSQTTDYNDYYVSGTGGVPAYYSGNKFTLPFIVGQDAGSFITDPFISIPGSTVATDYTIGADLIGAAGTGITTDFAATVRDNPTIGAWERIANKWKGTISTAWNVAGNWTANAVPLDNANIIFDSAPVRDCYLNTNHAVTNVTISSANKLVANGFQLTIKGDLTLTNGGQIDASSASSTLVLAGTSAQAISAASYGTSAYNLVVDNAAGVTLNSDFTVDNNLTINTGRSLVVSAPNLLTVTGTLANNAGNSGLVLRSSGNGADAKLINNTDLVSATVELYLSGGNGTYGPRYHYIVPPVQTFGIDNSSVAATRASLGLASFYGDLLLFDETKATTSKNAGWQYFDGWNTTTGFNELKSTRGYNIHLPSSDRITFTGQLNAIQHTYSLSYTGSISYPGWNLVGNPYPCNYNLGNIAEFTAGDNVDNTAYFNYEGGYGTWNFSLNSGTLNGSPSTVFSPIVGPMQGVYVHVIGSATMTLPVSGKTTSTAQPSRAKSGSFDYTPEKEIAEIRKIKLSLNFNNAVDETLVCLFDGATVGFDSDYDAFVLPEGLMPRGWTGIQTNPLISTGAGTQKYAINSLPLPDPSVPLIIPVTIKIKEAGSYTITVPEFENLAGTEVTLKHGAVTTKLEKGTTYKFNSLPGTYDNLALIIGSLTTENEEEKIGADSFRTWFRNDLLYVLSPAELSSQKARLIIYDIQGKPVTDKNIILTPGEIINVPVSLRGGIYLAHIVADGKNFITKFVVLQ